MKISNSSKHLMLVSALLVCRLGVATFVQSVQIECIPLKTCPAVLKLLSLRKSTPETKEFFKISFCGFDEKKQPMVWCPRLNFCKTPHNFNGTCTPINECKSFMKLTANLDPTDLITQSLLNKFRCNTILKENHVCCPTENLFGYLHRFEYEQEPAASRDHSQATNIHTNMNFRSGGLDDDYNDGNLPYGWASDQPGNYENHFRNPYPPKNSFYDTTRIPTHSHHMWHHNHRRNDGMSIFSHHNSPDFRHELDSGHLNNIVPNHEFGNNNKRGTDHGKGSVYDATEREYRDHSLPTTPSTRQLHNTPIRRDWKAIRDSNENITPETIDWISSTTSGSRRTTDMGNFDRTTSSSRGTTISNRGTTYEGNRRTIDMDSFERTTYKGRDTLSNNGGAYEGNSGDTTSKVSSGSTDEGRVIFEYSSETTEQIRTAVDRTTDGHGNSTEEEGSVCETPDRKAGVCVRESTCQSYQNLKNNLDSSKSGIREYLTKFRCNSNNTREIYVCCQSDENNINNTVIKLERTNGGVSEPYAKICGRQTASTDRIFGGTMADIGEFPWIALLRYVSNRGMISGCGGTLISSRYVLTAAHCVDEAILKSKGLGRLRDVVLGEYDTRNKTDCIYSQYGDNCADPPRTFGVASIVTHDLYSTDSARNDIALIRLSQEVTITDYIIPICLPTKATSLQGNETFTIAGWGKTPTEKSSSVLRKANVAFAQKQNCDARNTNSRSLIDGQICVGRGNGTDSCNGDSGGPLMLEVNINFELATHLVGIISYGFGECGTAPSVNTYIPFYVDWISSNMR